MSNPESPFTLSLHIPKTAGTTLESILLKKYGERLYRYNSNPELLNTKKAGWIMDNYDAIHGHFDVNKFDLADSNINAFCFVREPYDRLVSHFNYYKQNFIEGPYSELVYDGTVDFEAFSFSDNMKNLQSRMMGNYSAQDYDLVGNSKRFNSYIPVVNKLIGEESSDTTHEQLNVSKRSTKKVFEPDEQFMSRFKEFHSADYALFDSVEGGQLAKSA